MSFKWIIKPICDEFESLFRDLFVVEKNLECLNKLYRLISDENWDVVINFILHVQQRALVLIKDRIKSHRGISGKAEGMIW